MSATSVAPQKIPHDTEIFLASRWSQPSSAETVDVVSPSTGEVVHQLPVVSVDDAKVVVERARAAFESWNAASLDERREVVARFCKAVDARLPAMEQVWAVEAGMPVQTGAAFSMATTLIANDALAISETLKLSEIRDTPAGRAEVRHEGIGPTVAIVTYNGPHVECAMAVVPGLLAGNTFIVKLPPESRMLGYLMADAAAEAEFPEGVISILAAEADVSKFLVEHEEVDAVHFTGGNSVGVEIAKSCAPRIARITLELGGKSAAIIADDADLDEVIPQLVGGMTRYGGQICVALTRILVSRARHDEVVDRLVSAFGAVAIGDPLDPATEYGPLAAERVRARAEGFIERAVADGATIAYGGGRPEGFDNGWYLEPTLLTNVDNSMEVAQEEIFGPVFAVIPFDDIDHAVAIANDSKYGLSGAVFTKDEDVARDVALRVRAGTFAINGAAPCLTAPFGGMKQSGFGREGGKEAILELTNIKSIALPAA